MTDTLSNPNIEALRPMYLAVMGQIKAIDEKLEMASGGKSAGKRAIINGYVRDNENAVNAMFTQLMDQAFGEGIPEDVQIALYYGVTAKLKDALVEQFEKVLEPLVLKVPEAEKIPDEEINRLVAERSEAFKQTKYVRDLLGMFGADVEGEFPAPKRRGGGGKRGERAITKFSWTLDGDRMPADADTLTGVSKKLGFEKSVTLRDLMRDAEINLKDPVDPIEFTLLAENSPDGQEHVIVGNKRPEEDNEDEEDDDEGEDDE